MLFFQIVHKKPKECSFELRKSLSLAALHEQNEVLKYEQVNQVQGRVRLYLSDVVKGHQARFKQASVGIRRSWGILTALLLI